MAYGIPLDKHGHGAACARACTQACARLLATRKPPGFHLSIRPRQNRLWSLEAAIPALQPRVVSQPCVRLSLSRGERSLVAISCSAISSRPSQHCMRNTCPRFHRSVLPTRPHRPARPEGGLLHEACIRNFSTVVAHTEFPRIQLFK